MTALYISSSACALSCAFLMPTYCSFFVFIFLTPIFYVVLMQKAQHWFLVGLLWGIIFWATHLVGIVMVLHERGCGPHRLLFGVGLIVYCALHAGLWFFSGHRMSLLYKTSSWWPGLCWLVTTEFYFIIVTHYMLWPFGVVMGYCFANPLLPLAQYPFLLRSLPHIGPHVLLGFLIVGQYLIAVVFYSKSKKALLCGALCFLPFVWGWFDIKNVKIPYQATKIGYISPPARQLLVWQAAEDINWRIVLLRQHSPNIHTIVMPESALPVLLNQHQNIIDLWGANALEDEITLLIGASRSDQQNEYNSFYKIRGCRITNYYDKNFYLPFTEYCPWPWNYFNCFTNLFLKNKKGFSPKENSRVFFSLTADCVVVPQLCSDLFFEHGFEQACMPRSPILFAVNDGWFSAQYMRHLMQLFAVFKAVQYNRDIIYVGHFFGVWIDKETGHSFFLAQ